MELEKDKIKYFIYARRSVEKRDTEEKVVSIESQVKEMKELAEKNNLKVVGVFSEAKSAKEPYLRTQFNEMIKQIEAGKANGILCFVISRLARNSIEEGIIKHLLQKSIIKNIKTPDRDWLPGDNVLLASLDFGIATQYSIDLTKHVKRGLRASCDTGYRPSYAPLGYTNSRYHQKGKQEKILVDEERFSLVREVFDWILSDKYTVSEVYRMIKEKNLLKIRGISKYSSKVMSKSYLFTMISNPFYYGEFEYPVRSGNWYIGNHKPMITKDEYYRVQEIIGNKPRREQKYTFAYTGIIKCGECGGSITAERKVKRQKNGNVHRYTYYHCTKRKHPECTQQCILEEDLENQVLEYLNELCIPQEFHEWALEAIEEIKKIESKNSEKAITLKKTMYSNNENKLSALLDMRLSGEISPIDYTSKKSSIEAEMTNLKSEMIGEGEEEVWVNKTRDALTFAKNIITEYEKGDMETKRMILQSIGSNLLLLNKKLTITIEKPFLLFSEMKKQPLNRKDMLEPLKVFINKDESIKM